MSRPSTPSDSSVLALHDFTYNRAEHTIEYPPGHDESQPPTPVSSRLPRRSHARAYSLSLIDRSLMSPHPRRSEDDAMGRGTEFGLTGRKGADDDQMDGFTFGEIIVMAGSSLMVLALIGVAATLTLGKVKL